MIIDKEKIDKQPKRLHKKDNPYYIYSTGKNTNCPKYYVFFRDSEGKDNNIEINETIFRAFDRFELDDISLLHKIDKHMSFKDIETHLESNQLQEQYNPIETYLNNSVLYDAISKLSIKHRRRIIMYYFKGYSVKQIATIEHCSHQAISSSIKKAKEMIKDYLINS